MPDYRSKEALYYAFDRMGQRVGRVLHPRQPVWISGKPGHLVNCTSYLEIRLQGEKSASNYDPEDPRIAWEAPTSAPFDQMQMQKIQSKLYLSAEDPDGSR